jgi:type I restriction enzyme S subunit
MATNQGFKNLVPEKEIETWYLYYRMLETANFLNSVGSGSTFDEVSKTEVQSVDIPIPPLPEQRKIATVLYTVDRAIEKSKEIKTQLERTHNGLIQDFLTHGIQDSETIDTGTKLGEAPSHWEIVTIENILSDEDYSFTDGARYSLSSDEIQGSGDARTILLEEVKEGEFDDSNPKFATEEKYNEITHRAIYPGEVVVAKMAEPVARACIVPDTYEKYLLGCADVVRIVPNEEIEDRFLMYCMNSHKVWRQAVAHLRGTGRSRINLENISELYIPKPPLSEQREIVSILSRIDQKIDNEQQYQDNLQRLKRGLQQDLLSGTVRTTNSNIEVPDEIAQHG